MEYSCAAKRRALYSTMLFKIIFHGLQHSLNLPIQISSPGQCNLLRHPTLSWEPLQTIAHLRRAAIRVAQLQQIYAFLRYPIVSLCDSGGNVKTRKFCRNCPTRIAARRRCTIVCSGSQLSVGCRKRFHWPGEGIWIGKLSLCCKAWKMIMNSTVEYNVLCLAAHEYSMGPHGIPELCLSREHNLVKLLKINFMLFSQSRHVTSLISNRILR